MKKENKDSIYINKIIVEIKNILNKGKKLTQREVSKNTIIDRHIVMRLWDKSIKIIEDQLTKKTSINIKNYFEKNSLINLKNEIWVDIIGYK